MSLMKKYLHSKWTSLERINGWKHYEVKNVFVEKKEIEMFSVCNKGDLVRIKINDINNKRKWLPGWKEII